MFFNKLNLAVLALGLALAPFVPSVAHAKVAYPADEKHEALLFVSSQLQVLSDDDATLDYFIDVQEDILAGEANPSVVRTLAHRYRTNANFKKLFAPKHKVAFEQGGIYHVQDVSGSIILAERCYGFDFKSRTCS